MKISALTIHKNTGIEISTICHKITIIKIICCEDMMTGSFPFFQTKYNYDSIKYLSIFHHTDKRHLFPIDLTYLGETVNNCCLK